LSCRFRYGKQDETDELADPLDLPAVSSGTEAGDIRFPSEPCEECSRLWEEFVEATNAHLRTLGRLQAAVIQQDSATQAQLRQDVAEFAARRQSARNGFKTHAATHRKGNQESDL